MDDSVYNIFDSSKNGYLVLKLIDKKDLQYFEILYSNRKIIQILGISNQKEIKLIKHMIIGSNIQISLEIKNMIIELLNNSEFYSSYSGEYFRIEILEAKNFDIIVTFNDITKHKQKEKELEFFFDVTPELLCVADTEGNFLKVNNEWKNALGYDKEFLESHKFLDFVHHDDLDKTLDEISNLKNQKKVINFVNRYKCSDGTYKFLEWRSYPKEDKIYASARDITFRIKAEEQILFSRQRAIENQRFFNAIFSQSPLSIQLFDENGLTIEVNKSWEKLWNVKKEDVIGKYNVLQDPYAKDSGWSFYIKKAFNGEIVEPPLMDYDPRKNGYHDGRKRSLKSVVAPIFIDGKLKNVIIFHQDVTQMKQAQEELILSKREVEKSLSSLQLILELAPDAFFHFNSQNELLDINSRALELTGYKKEEIIKRNISDFFNFINSDLFKNRVLLKKSGDIIKETLILRRNNGAFSTVEINSRNLSDGSFILFARDITVQIENYNLLKKSEERSKALVSAIPDMIFLFDEKGTFIDFSTQDNSSLYIRPEFFVGKNIRDVLPKNIADLTLINIRNIQKKGKSDPYFYDINIEGDVRYYESRMVPCGKDHFLAIVRDVTNDVLTKNRLEESEKSKSVIISNLPGVAYKCKYDSVRNFEFMSDGVYRLTGFFPEELTNNSTYDFDSLIADDFRSTITEGWKNSVEKRETFFAEYKIKTRTGDEKWVLEQGLPLFDQFNRITSLEGLIIDITKRKQMEELLKKSEKRFRSFFDQPVIGAGIISLEGKWISVNDKLCEILGYTRDELTKKTWQEITKKSDLEEENIRYKKYIGSENSLGSTYEKKYIHKSGKEVDVLLSFNCVRDEVGNPDYIVSYILDITERKEMMNKIHNMKKMESIGKLAGGIAHDFNNMLASVITNTQLGLRKCDNPEKVKSYFEQILSTSIKTTDLVKQLLAFSRNQEINPKLVDINEIIEDSLSMLSGLVGENIDIKWKPDSKLPKILADVVQLNQIITNLCVNSRDAITGKGVIEISTHLKIIEENHSLNRSDMEPGTYVILEVVDSGIGMDTETLNHIYEPFFTTKEIGKGTGLGLATVYGNVTQNKGFINVSSKIGHGTIFQIFFPAVLERKFQEIDTFSQTKQREKATILIVEDEINLLEVAAEMLSMLNYKIHKANSGKEAIEIVLKENMKIDLLLTDVIMPEMNGKELSIEIENLQPSVKVLFMSGYTANIIEQHGILNRGNRFIQKPFTLDELSEKIGSILNNNH
ncbi:MAG: PAS domain S-box protein [Candidatus Delongbacteria bacterium]|nr:PAS domain S-box protein [Candidatus Delongbacteria bacterium]MBN2833994.1 PAS domain S-box protein [Candidatus Delongbacteria bacterium]